MFGLKLFFLIVSVTLRSGCADECMTPNNEAAECILLYNCPILLNAISDSTNREFIRRSNCGGTPIEPKVCCGSYSNFTSNECVTPNNETAVCTSLYACPVLVNALSDPTKLKFVRQSNCGGTPIEPKVCCGSHSNFTTDACVTPNNETAVCTSLYSCPILLNALSVHTNRKFIYQSNCGGTPMEPKVCCGSHSNFTVDKKKKPKPALADLLPKRVYCGMQHSDDYFHTAVDTGINEFPWLAVIVHKSIDETDNFSYRRFCSGSLISERYVLTTAECLLTTNVKPVGVRLGEYHMSNATDCVEDSDFIECSESLQDFAIEKYVTHPDYVKHGVNAIHNIGLIRLNTTVLYTDYIRPICLPLPGTKKPAVGDILTTSGWGVAQTQAHSETKKRTFSELITNQDCENRFRQGNITVKLIDGEICGVLVSHSELICVGDGGIPVTYSHKSRWYQEAIVSLPTCEQASPNIYTKVAHYLDWIEENFEP